MQCETITLDHAKQTSTDVLKIVSNRAIQKIAESTGDLTDNAIADKITKFSRSSPQSSSGAVESEAKNIGFDREIPKEIFIFPEKRQQVMFSYIKYLHV